MNTPDTPTTTMPTAQPKFQAALDLAVRASTHQPEQFQADLMEQHHEGVCCATHHRSCLPRAPTARATFVMGQVLQRVGAQRNVLWFLVCPFVTLVGQTLDSLLQHASGLSPVLFLTGAQSGPGCGHGAHFHRIAGVACAQWRKTTTRDADDVRTFGGLGHSARAKGFRLACGG